jgi:hypothetical protein
MSDLDFNYRILVHRKSRMDEKRLGHAAHCHGSFTYFDIPTERPSLYLYISSFKECILFQYLKHTHIFLFNRYGLKRMDFKIAKKKYRILIINNFFMFKRKHQII